MSDCNCNSAPGQHKDDYTYHADNCPFFLYGHIAELEQQVEDYENKLASGVHTCSNTCKRPMCVLRREKEALQQQVEALRRAAAPFEILARDRLMTDGNLARPDNVGMGVYEFRPARGDYDITVTLGDCRTLVRIFDDEPPIEQQEKRE
jgi:hypothetical protein